MMALWMLLGLVQAAEPDPPELAVLYQGQAVSPQAFATLVGDHTTLAELSRQRRNHRRLTGLTAVGGLAVAGLAWVPLYRDPPSMPRPDDHLPERSAFLNAGDYEEALASGQAELDAERRSVATRHRLRAVAGAALITSGVALACTAPLVHRRLGARQSRLDQYYSPVDARMLAESRPELELRVVGAGLEATVEF